jgi:broad specificity phosphatase PhoE
MRGERTLVFMRHGETDWNVEARLQGQQDIPLNARGRAQAAAYAEVLRREIPEFERFHFVTSPLGRAVETMRILRRALGLDPNGYRVEPELIEITFGSWEGFTLAELAADGSDAARRREADKWGYVPPNGESYAMLSARIGRWLRSLDGDTVAVSHGAVGRVVQGLLLGAEKAEIPSLPSPQDRLLIFRAGKALWV